MIRDIISLYLTNEELIDFELWAFGDMSEIENSIDVLNAWNSLHKHKLKLDMDGNIRKDIESMIEIWRSREA